MATYYVNRAGSGSGDGSLGDPWKNLSEITGLSAGDYVYFNKGDTWRFQLTIPSSGSAGSPITFGAYGSGADPIICGSDSKTGWSQYLATNIYSVSCNWNARLVFENGTFLTYVDWDTDIATTAAAMSASTWTLDTTNDLVYVWASDGADPDTHTMEVGKRNLCIYMSTKNYIIIENLEVKHANGTAIAGNGGGAGIGINHTTGTNGNVTIQDCTIHDCCWAGIHLGGNRTNRSTNMLVERCTLYNNSWYGIASGGANSGSLVTMYISNSTIRNCTVYSDQEHGLRLRRSDNLTIQNNTCYNNGSSGIVLDKTGYADDDQVTTNCIVRYNLCYGNAQVDTAKDEIGTVGTGGTAGNNQIYYNVMYGGGNVGLKLSGSDTDYIYNNTIYNSAAEGIYAADSSANLVVKNNIVSTSGSEHMRFASGSTTGHDIDYNLYGDDGATKFDWGGTDYTFANWQTNSGQDAASSVEDPLFVDAANADFQLKSDSPCRNAGVDVGLARDYSSEQVHLPPDIGAYEIRGVKISPINYIKYLKG